MPSDQEWADARAVVKADADAKEAADEAAKALELLVRNMRAQDPPVSWQKMSDELGLKISHLRWLETAYLKRRDREQ